MRLYCGFGGASRPLRGKGKRLIVRGCASFPTLQLFVRRHHTGHSDRRFRSFTNLSVQYGRAHGVYRVESQRCPPRAACLEKKVVPPKEKIKEPRPRDEQRAAVEESGPARSASSARRLRWLVLRREGGIWPAKPIRATQHRSTRSDPREERVSHRGPARRCVRSLGTKVRCGDRHGEAWWRFGACKTDARDAPPVSSIGRARTYRGARSPLSAHARRGRSEAEP